MLQKTSSYLLIFIGFFLCTAQLVSQIKITGKVIKKENTPISSANIILLDSTQKVLVGATTDKLGNFSIAYKNAGNYTLKISHVGFKDYLQKISHTDDLGAILLTSDQLLKEVSVVAKPTLSPKTKEGKHTVNVVGTSFATTENVWEGLKQVPMLTTTNRELKVFNKNAIIEIDGIQTQMNGEDLQDYLASLSPDAIKRIEINPNPDASYGSEVNAVINLITQNSFENYRLGLRTTHGLRSNYFNNDNANISLNTKSVKVYSNYSFRYSKRVNESEIEQEIDKRFSTIDYKDNTNDRSHRLLLNLNFKLGERDMLDLTQIFNQQNSELFGENTGENFNKKISLVSSQRFIQLAQIWKHKVSDSASFKLGFYEIFDDNQSENRSELNGAKDLEQNIFSKTPLWIGFFNYKWLNGWGQMKLGIKYHDINVKNENETLSNPNINAPFGYREKVLAGYVNQSVVFSPTQSLDFGIRSESSWIDYSFTDGLSDKTASNRLTYTNILYHINYNWYSVSSGWFGSLALRKQISRPDYRYLNPFQSINTDVTLSAGDSEINPSNIYSLSYSTGSQVWVFYTELALINDFISNVMELDNKNLVQTYRNFDHVYIGAIGAQYNDAFFGDYWTTKNIINVSYAKLDDADFNTNLEPPTPIVYCNTINNLKVGELFKLGIDYEFRPTFHDGVYRHLLAHQLDITLSKKINDFRFSFFARDVFQTQYQADSISLTDFSYQSNYYFDTRSWGLTLSWSITGEKYTQRKMESSSDDSINRLKSAKEQE